MKMSDDEISRDDLLGRWVDVLLQRLESQPLLWIQGKERDRIACLRRWLSAVSESGAGVRSLDGRSGEAPLVSRLPSAKEGGEIRLLVIDHWQPDRIAPGQIEFFQKWLGEFTGEGPATVAFGVDEGALFEDEKAELAPLPDWAVDEVETITLAELRDEDSSSDIVEDSVDDLFPALAGAAGPTRSAQFPVGARNRLPEDDPSSSFELT